MDTTPASDNKVINLYFESNPNPASLKFVTDFLLVPQEGMSYDFPDLESAKDSLLAQSLFAHDYVDRVFIMNNFITITKKEGVDWEEIKNHLREEIKDYLRSGRPLVSEQAESSNLIEDDDPEIVKTIKNILEEYIKPAVEQDGGAITFDSYEEGVVKVKLMGACSGCPSSTVTLKAGIENLLKRMVPDVKTVEAESV